MKNFKKFLTLVLAVMMVVSSVAFSTSAATTKFEDIDADNDVLVEAVDLLNYMGVAKGTSETTFGADELVTRQQFALFIYRLMKGGKDAPAGAANSTKFTDLEDPTYTYAIAWANAEGIVNGKSETTFAPKDGIKLQEAYAMIVRALDWEEENDLVYPFGHIEIAEQEGVELDEGLASSVGYADELTRADMAVLLYNAFFAETGIEEVDTREREIGSGDNATWVLEEYTTNPRLCEKAFDVVEVEYQATATPAYQYGDAEATYDLGYEAAYFTKVEDSEVNEDAVEAPGAVYLTPEELGLEEGTLDAYFLGEFTMFVTIDDDEIEKVLFADCNMTKKTVTDLKLGEISSNKAESYFDGTDAKLLSGKLTAEGTEDMYIYNAPYTYASETYATGATSYEKYLTRNTKNLKAIGLEMDKDGEDVYYTATVAEIVTEPDETDVEDGYFAVQADELVEAFTQVYYDGLYEADLYDVDGDGLYDYINYKPYSLFQVDSDEDEYFEDSDFEAADHDVPYIYTQEATVLGEDFADEDYVIGYFSAELETVKVAAVIKPTVDSVKSYKKGTGMVTLASGEVVDAASAWKMLVNYLPEEIVYDEDLFKSELIDASDLFSSDVLDGEELEFYIYDGVVLFNEDVDTVSKFTENLIIPTDIKPVKAGPFDPATGNTAYYVYAYVDGDVKYVAVSVDDDIDNPIVDEDGVYNSAYTNTFCTYTVKDGIYTIVPLEFDLLEDGDVEKEALSQDTALLDGDEDEDQVFAPTLGNTIEKVAGSRFNIGLEITGKERSVDFKSFTKIIIRVYDADEDEYDYVEYDAASFKKSLDEDTVLENMKAIVSNNPDSVTRENLVLLYAETDDLAFAGKADKNGYRIISNNDIGEDAEGEWRLYYELYDPYTGAKVSDVASVNSESKASNLQEALPAGTIVELVDGMVDDEDDDYNVGTVETANLVWIGEVDEAEGYFVAVPYDESLTVKDEIDAYVEAGEGAITDIYGEAIPGNFIDFDKDTVVSVMKYDEYNTSFWKWGTMSLSNMSTIAAAKKEVLCWNDKALDRNDNFVTKYADYVKAYLSVDADNLDDDENPVAEFIIVIVNGAENAALDA